MCFFTTSQPPVGGTAVRFGQNPLHIREVILAQAQRSLPCQTLKCTESIHSYTELRISFLPFADSRLNTSFPG